MKKLFILTIAILAGISGFAQRNVATYLQPINSIDQYRHNFSGSNPYGKTAAIGSTDTLSNISDTAHLTLYSYGVTADSGYVTGTDYWNDQAYAELYNFSGGDSSMQVIGVVAQFGGTVNPASTLTVNFNVWNIGLTAGDTLGATMIYGGFPGSILDSFTVPVTQLGIGTTADTMKVHIFSTPTSSLSGAFFVGYSVNYNFFSLNGDDFGLACSLNGDGTGNTFTVTPYIGDSTFDTVINVQNATMFSDGNWYDNYTQNDSFVNDLAIFPIVVISSPTGVKGVTRNNLTFFGNYPNPAVNSTNIKFSLANSMNVTIQIMDMAGRTINTISEPGLAAGEHIIPVNTTDMAAGDYLYLIRTSSGDGLAGKMTIVK